MNDWGPAAYGDPCRECGFRWTTRRPTPSHLLPTSPLLSVVCLKVGQGPNNIQISTGRSAGYVLHVADNLRIWAERLMGVLEVRLRRGELRRGRSWPMLAATRRSRCRRHCGHSTRSVDDWLAAVEAAPVFRRGHGPSGRGELVLSDVVLSNAHDALHHRWDIERTLGDLRQ